MKLIYECMKCYFYRVLTFIIKEKSRNSVWNSSIIFYAPMQLVAPSAVTIAVATDAIICTMNLMVSLFVMVD